MDPARRETCANMSAAASAPPTRLLRLWLPRARATAALASAAASEAHAGDLLLLRGAVGAGKSEFARHFVREAVGNALLPVPSPTFLLQHSYEMPGKVMLHHYDLYRIDDTRSLGRLQLRERFTDAVCVVEWPEIIPEADLLAERLDVKLDICGDDTVPQTVLRDVKAADEGDDMDGDGGEYEDRQCRKVELEARGSRWCAFCQAMEDAVKKLDDEGRQDFGGIRLVDA